jgi:CopG family transcriptional regulator, nickel-responsive regulator
MEKITRKGIAFEKEQLKLFDTVIRKKGYKNRSEAIRDLIRKELIEEQQKNSESRMMATLTMVYGHHEHDVQHNLTHIQHHHPKLIRSTFHVHMDDENCMEVLILEGKVKDIKDLSNLMLAEKGVKHGKLVMTGI